MWILEGPAIHAFLTSRGVREGPTVSADIFPDIVVDIDYLLKSFYVSERATSTSNLQTTI